jgi:hypothetical protein
MTPRRGVTLHAGVVADPAANAAFRKRANARCRDASSALDARPPISATLVRVGDCVL